MADTITKGDFVEVEYTGRLKGSNAVFDTTDEKIAKESTLHEGKMKYGAITVCIGEGHLLKGLDAAMQGKEVGKQYTVELSAEQAFGRKNSKLIQLIPTTKFLKEKIQPMPGLQINVDGMYGVVKSVSGGRTLVDFNHPLSGKDIVYDIKVNKKVTDAATKVRTVVGLTLQKEDVKVTVNEGKAIIDFKLPKELHAMLKEQVTKLVPEIKDVEFKE